MQQLRVLVVDDSTSFLRVLIDSINHKAETRVVGYASNGKEAVEKALAVEPDLITLDIEMPVMDGITALKLLKEKLPGTPVVMISSPTIHSAKRTIEALEIGAQGFIEKPDTGDPAANMALIAEQLDVIIKETFAAKRGSATGSTQPVARSEKKFPVPKVVAIASSTGGPKALAEIIPYIPGDISVPLVLVQHMPAVFTKSLAESLDSKSRIKVVEAVDRQVLKPATLYIAPGGYQMKVIKGNGDGMAVELTDDPPENFCKPAADYLFRSVALEYRENALGVILTGMGKDGTLGLKVMKRFGVKVIGQDESTCTVYGMSREAKAAGVVDVELPVGSIANEIAVTVKGG